MTRRTFDPEVTGRNNGYYWAAAVVAVSNGAASVYGLYADKRIAIFAFLGMVFAIVLLLVVQHAVRVVGKEDARFYNILVKVLAVFVVLYFMVLAIALFPVLLRWLSNSTPPRAVFCIDAHYPIL